MEAELDDRIDLMDQGSFLGLSALGHQPCFLATWTYSRPVDLEALRRVNQNLCRTLAGRLVERSPLPGGRHRWVAADRAPNLVVEATPRERDQVFAWTSEFGDRGTDPEHGPGWRIGVLSLTDGGAAVALAIPHTLGDGLCVLQAISDAVEGRHRRPAYPSRTAGRRGRVLWADLVSFIRDLPAVLRAVLAAIRVARAQANPRASGKPPKIPTADAAASEPTSGPFHPPAACVRVTQAAWDTAAADRGGTSNTLVSAVAARLGERLHRTGADGMVTLAVPVSVRVEGDTRANALDSATIRTIPGGLADDLTELRAATKAALMAVADQSHDLAAALPITPLMPAAVVRRAEPLAMGAAALPVGCSNYGDLPAAVVRLDGGDAADFWVRLIEPGQGPADLDRIGGQLYVLSGRALGNVFLSIVARPVGGGLDNDGLHRHVADTLAEFGLSPALVTR